MKIVLAGERPQSRNIANKNLHWSHRATEAQRVHSLVKADVNRSVLPLDIIALPVDITITAYFKNRPLDADNISAKAYIDALKGWLIKDDSPEYVRSVTTSSRTDKENPRLEIEIEEVGE